MDQLIPVIFAALVPLFFVLWQRWMSSNFDYQCAICGEIFSLPSWQAMIVPHMVEAKLVKCSYCGQMTWARPVSKGNGS